MGFIEGLGGLRKGCRTCTNASLGFNEGPCKGCDPSSDWPRWEWDEPLASLDFILGLVDNDT